MKRLLLTFILLSFFSLKSSIAQSSIEHSSCCETPLGDALSFADFGNDEKFISAHLPPAPLEFEPKVGRMVSIKIEGGKEAAVFEVKSGKSDGSLILMFHEWWGLNEYILREAERVHFATGATVLAVDLYDGKVATNAEDANKYMKSVQPERAEAIIKSLLEYGGKFSRVQTIGWCMGGGWSLQASILAGQQGYGCVVYYGMPETNKDKLMQLGGPVLGIYGKKDAWITPELVQEFDQNMKTVKKEFTVLSFDADHAFANPSNPKYDKAATAKANAAALAFIKKNFLVPFRRPAEK